MHSARITDQSRVGRRLAGALHRRDRAIDQRVIACLERLAIGAPGDVEVIGRSVQRGGIGGGGLTDLPVTIGGPGTGISGEIVSAAIGPGGRRDGQRQPGKN
jgi:hypothetical protein